MSLARPRPRGGDGAIRSKPKSNSGRREADLAERVVMEDMLCNHTTSGRRWHGPSVLAEGVRKECVCVCVYSYGIHHKILSNCAPSYRIHDKILSKYAPGYRMHYEILINHAPGHRIHHKILSNCAPGFGIHYEVLSG